MSSPKKTYLTPESNSFCGTSQWSRSFAWENVQDRTLCSKTSQPLTSLYPVDREVTGSIPTPISSFKVHHVRGDKDQWPGSNSNYVQTDMILLHVSLLWA
ncbi:hypothetical protein TNCV_671751 [Trichonephila clavipes]|nr:hypothetical protein TNCV_671751 [Trichonephila clavipes]